MGADDCLSKPFDVDALGSSAVVTGCLLRWPPTQGNVKIGPSYQAVTKTGLSARMSPCRRDPVYSLF